MKQLLYLLLLINASRGIGHATELDSINVHGTSVLESEHLSPVPVNIITKEEIIKAGAVRLQEALYLQEGISFVRSGNKLAPSIRGFNPEHTLLLINGQRLANEPTNKFDLERLDLATVERIEIIKGPLSTIYGADALGGVINIITGPIVKDKITLTARTAAYDFKSPRQAVSAQIDKKIGNMGLSLFGTRLEEDALYYNRRETIDDKKKVHNMGVGLEYAKGPFLFKGRQTWSGDKHKASYFNFLNSNYVYDVDDHRRTLTSGELSYKKVHLKHVFRITNTTYKKKGDTHLQDNDLLLMKKRASIDTTEISYRGEMALENHSLTIGTGHRQEDFYGNAFNYEDHSRYLPEYTWVYVADQWALNDRLLIVPSFRQEKINYFEDKLLGQFGATLFLDDKLEQNLKFNFAQGYRVPTPKDLYVDVMIMKGNPNLGPETTNSYNLEYGLLSHVWEVRAAYFYNDVNGLIQEFYDPSIGKYSFRNIAGSVIQGTEVKVRRKFTRFENTFTHTFLQANENNGRRLPNRARHQAVFNTTINPGAFSVSNDVSCRTDELLYDENNDLHAFDYCSVDLEVYYKFSKYQLTIKGFNLLNHFERSLPQRPRLLSMFLNAQF